MSDVTSVPCQCTCVALKCPSVWGHTCTMWVMFMPQGSQMGSPNSCLHEAWADPVWRSWHANQYKCSEVAHADMFTWACWNHYTQGQAQTFWPVPRAGTFPRMKSCFQDVLFELRSLGHYINSFKKKKHSLPALKRSTQSAQASSYEVLHYVPRLRSKYTHTHTTLWTQPLKSGVAVYPKVQGVSILNLSPEAKWVTLVQKHLCQPQLQHSENQHGVRRPKLLDILNTLLCHHHSNRNIACMSYPGKI